MATATKGRLPKAKRAVTLGGSKPSQESRMAPQNKKQLSKAEKQTAIGKFALHLQALLDERGWDSHKLAERISVGEPAVRRWLRAEAMPGDLKLLRELGEAMHTAKHPFADWRLILPKDV